MCNRRFERIYRIDRDQQARPPVSEGLRAGCCELTAEQRAEHEARLLQDQRRVQAELRRLGFDPKQQGYGGG